MGVIISSRAVTDSLSIKAGQLFGAEERPAYIAGGHEWSDGTIYQALHPMGQIMIKLVPDANRHSLLRLSERLEFFEYLKANGIQAASPLPSIRGNILEILQSDHEQMIARAWIKIPGEHIPDSHPRDLTWFYRAWGELVGKAHRLAERHVQWKHSSAQDDYGKPLFCWQDEWELFHNWLKDVEVKKAWEGIRSELERLPVSRENFGFIHNDPHPENILVNDQGLALLDPEVANYHWFMTDLGICLNSEHSRIGHHSKHKAALDDLPELFVRPFKAGYHSQNRLPAEEYSHIRLFLRYRRFLMYAVFYQQILRHDPEYLKGFTRELVEGECPAADLMETEFVRQSGL